MTFPATILPIVVEAYIDGAWTDITSYVQTRGGDVVEITYGRANESQTVEPSRMMLSLNNRDGRFSPRNPMSPYYGKIGRNTPIRASITDTSGYLAITASSGITPTTAYVSTPDTAALDITGDIDVRVEIDLDAWSGGWTMELVSKWTEAGNQRSYLFSAESDATLRWSWSTDGISATAGVHSDVLPITSGRLAVRATLDVDNGAGGRVTTFYTAATIAGPWTVLTTKVGAATTSIFSGTGIACVGDNPNSTWATSVSRGKIYAAQIYNGIGGTLVANPDFTAQANGATSFADSTGKTWTLHGDVALTNRDIRFTGQITQWPQKWDSTGTDVWVPVEAYGPLRRLGQGNSPLQSTMRSGVLSRQGTSLLAYWPLEDELDSASAATAMPDGYPMTITAGTPTFAADDSFACSSPLVQATNGSLSGAVKKNTSTGSIDVQMLLHVPVAGTTNNAVLLQVTTTGTARRWDLIYGTGGFLQLNAYDSDGVFIATGIPMTWFEVDGRLKKVAIELTTSGANAGCKIAMIEVGTETAYVMTGSVASRTIGTPARLQIAPHADINDVTFGHLSVDNTILNLFTSNDQLNAYQAEPAGTRISRLCGEKGIIFTARGDLTDTVLMGPQLPTAFLDLLQECVDADLGILVETRDRLGLGYIPRSALYLQSPDLALDYSLQHLSALEPVEDDQLIRNDVTGTRPRGSSFRASLDEGRMSTQDPPDGIGVYDTTVALNVETDAALAGTVGWLLRLGTIDEPRYPTIVIDLARTVFASDSTLTRQAASLDVGSRVTVSNPPDWIPPEDISQVVYGYVETLAQYTRTLSLNCVPAAPYDTVGMWGDADAVARYSSDGSTVGTTMNTTTTTMKIATAVGPLWITTVGRPADFPIPVIVEGEQMTITAITGTTSPQTATVTRSVNGVVKSHTAGAAIDLYPISYYAL